LFLSTVCDLAGIDRPFIIDRSEKRWHFLAGSFPFDALGSRAVHAGTRFEASPATETCPFAGQAALWESSLSRQVIEVVRGLVDRSDPCGRDDRGLFRADH